MHTRPPTTPWRRRASYAFAAALAVALTAPFGAPAFADPPAWAPAHGYRAKHKKPKIRHYEPEGAHLAANVIDFGRCDRELIGSIIGGAGGALLGSTIGKGDGRLAAVAAGTFIGMIVGGSIGRSMDRIDEQCIAEGLERVPDGEPVVWRNPDAGADYRMTPVESYTDRNGQYCREFQPTVTIGGRTEQAYGTACRQPDGSWQVVG